MYVIINCDCNLSWGCELNWGNSTPLMSLQDRSTDCTFIHSYTLGVTETEMNCHLNLLLGDDCMCTCMYINRFSERESSIPAATTCTLAHLQI